MQHETESDSVVCVNRADTCFSAIPLIRTNGSLMKWCTSHLSLYLMDRVPPSELLKTLLDCSQHFLTYTLRLYLRLVSSCERPTRRHLITLSLNLNSSGSWALVAWLINYFSSKTAGRNTSQPCCAVFCCVQYNSVKLHAPATVYRTGVTTGE